MYKKTMITTRTRICKGTHCRCECWGNQLYYDGWEFWEKKRRL